MASERTKGEETDLTTALEAIAARMLVIYPKVHSIRVVGHGPDGEAVIPVPMAGEAEDLPALILECLNRIKPGEWVRAKTIAAEVDRDPSNGHFLRVLARLAKDGKIESNRNFGYRLTQPK